MVSEDVGRPQDQGRRHRRKTGSSPETVSLLARYQAAMRDELTAILDELAGADDGQIALDGRPRGRVRPSLADRTKLWDLGMKLGRELGTEVDLPAPVADPIAARPKARRVDYG